MNGTTWTWEALFNAIEKEAKRNRWSARTGNDDIHTTLKVFNNYCSLAYSRTQFKSFVCSYEYELLIAYVVDQITLFDFYAANYPSRKRAGDAVYLFKKLSLSWKIILKLLQSKDSEAET